MEKLKDYKEIFSEGMVIKNYKELCAMLDWKSKSGNSKASQLKELERFVGYTKKGNSFIINNVKQRPDEVQDMRSQNGRIYADHFETILCNILVNLNDRELTLTRAGWLSLVGAVNSDFVTYRMNTKIDKIQIAKSIGVTTYEIDYCINGVQRNLWDSFHNTLIALKNNYLITFEDVVIYSTEKDEWGDVWDEDIGVKVKGLIPAQRYKTSPDEYEEYREIIRERLDELHCKSERDIYKVVDDATGENMTLESFYKSIKERLKDEMGWVNHYRAIKIRYTQKQVENYLDLFALKDEKIKLNAKVIIQQLKLAARRYEKNKNEFSVYSIDNESKDIIEELGEYDFLKDEDKTFKSLGIKPLLSHPEHVERVSRIFNEFILNESF